MNKVLRTSIILGALAACVACGTARAGTLAGSGDPFEIWFDENGNGSYRILPGGPITLLPGALVGGYLTYMLPETVINGDVRVWEDASRQVMTDLMRFTDGQGSLQGFTADRMIYYSDVGDTDLADTGFPATLEPNDGGGIFEVGPEGNNGFDWYPGGNIYHGRSDVPEGGSTLALLGGALALVGAASRKLRK